MYVLDGNMFYCRSVKQEKIVLLFINSKIHQEADVDVSCQSTTDSI
ncbi:MAG: hypothetical protein ACI90V_004226 [Bacillariaceae sp.]|jgi:hypothetical protein